MPQGVYTTQNPIVLGKDAKVRIGLTYGQNPTTALGIRRGTMNLRGADHEVGDTEDTIAADTANSPGGGQGVAGYEAHQTGRLVAELNFMFYQAFNLAPHGATLKLIPMSYIVLWVYLKGFSFGQPYQFPLFNVQQVPVNIDLNQPSEGNIQGFSVGPFTMPTS
jgi:hypothetical protein